MAEEKEKEADQCHQSAEKQDPEKSMPPNEAQPNNAADEAKKAEDGGGAAAAAADGAAAGGGDDSKVPLNEDDAAKVKFSSNDAKVEMGEGKGAPDPYPALTKAELLEYATDPFWVRLRWILFVLFWLAWVAMLVASVAIIWVAPKCPAPAPKEWWQERPVYEVYVKSFKDSDDSGAGDINGIASKIDYLSDLGVGSVWLSPVFPSGGRDNGYDISNYKDVDPAYGSLQDLKDLISGLHERGIKAILDFVPNHSSDKHEWFQKSVRREEPYTDYYVWKAGSRSTPPNNWLSVFGGSAWTYNSERGEWYLHQFYPEQPDLNVRNEKVVEELEDVLRFWLDAGVDGFRMDAVAHLFEDEAFVSEKPREGRAGGSAYEDLDHERTYNLPETLELLKRFRKVLDEATAKDEENPRIMMTEAYLSNADLKDYYGTNFTDHSGDASHMPINFGLLDFKNRGDVTAEKLNKSITEYLEALPDNAWPNFNLGNHDNERLSTRVGDDLVDAMNMVYMLLPGTPITYYGEEIGMVDATNLPRNRPNSDDRDAHRTPMQWNANANAGFTGSASGPWLPVNPDYSTLNVQAQTDSKSSSHLKVYKALAEMREQKSVLYGECETHVDGDVFAYSRVKKGNPGYLVVVNTGDQEREVSLKANTEEDEEAKDPLQWLADNGKIEVRSSTAAKSDGEAEGGEEGEAAEEEDKAVVFTKIKVKPKEGLVITFVPQF